MTKKFGVTIGYHALWNAMQSHNLLEIEVGHLSSIIGGMARDEVRHLGESINNHHNGVFVPLGPRQTRDEIQANVLPRGLRNGEWRIQSLGQRMALGHLTSRTSFNEMLYIS